MLVLANTGEVAALSLLVNKTATENLRLRLYTNNLILKDTLTVGDFVEATYPGYAPITLSGSSWVVTPGSPSHADYPVTVFTCVSPVTPQTIYGYYVSRELTGDLMWAEKIAIPQILQAAGERMAIAPRITARDESD